MLEITFNEDGTVLEWEGEVKSSVTFEADPPRYTYEVQHGGSCVELFDREQESICFMQGDEASDFIRAMENIESMTFPSGPFDTCEDLQDYEISQYALNSEI